MGPAYQWLDGDLRLDLCVQPKAKSNQWLGPHGDCIRVRIQAPPVDGRANDALLAFVAGQFGVKKNAIKLLTGETSRRKKLLIQKPKILPEFIKHPTK